MNVSITLPDRREYRPGQTLKCRIDWQIPRPVRRTSARLIWFTSGKGSRDVGVAATQDLPTQNQGFADVQFTLPAGPYSFSGRLITLTWAVEFVAEPGDASERAEFTLSPIGREISLPGA